MMKKKNAAWILAIGVALFLASLKFDMQVNSFAESLRLEFLDLVFGFITNFGVVFVFMLIVPIIAVYSRDKKSSYTLLLAFIAAFALAFVMKLIFLRQRPDYVITYPLTQIINYSFPSMHALVVFALLPILIQHLPQQKNFWISFAFLVALSRVYLGFHFLSDVVFGGLAGYFLGGFLLEMHERKKLWK